MTTPDAQDELPLPLAVRHAENLAEAMRSLNRATLNVGQVQYPAEVDIILAHLETTVRGMPQALRQLSHWLRVRHGQGQVGHDHGDDKAAAAVEEALEELAEAVREADNLRISLSNARTFTWHLTGKTPPDQPSP